MFDYNITPSVIVEGAEGLAYSSAEKVYLIKNEKNYLLLLQH
jgi:hypothetical protein